MVPTLSLFYRLTFPGIRVNNLNDMKKCVLLNYELRNILHALILVGDMIMFPENLILQEIIP